MGVPDKSSFFLFTMLQILNRDRKIIQPIRLPFQTSSIEDKFGQRDKPINESLDQIHSRDHPRLFKFG